MKKAVLLIAALLMVGGMAFAVPNTGYGIWGRTVFTLAAGSTNPATTNVYQGWGPNWWGNGPRMGLDVWMSNDKAEFRFGWHWNGEAVRVVDLFGTVKFIPDLLTVYVGDLEGDGFDDFRKNTPHTVNDMHNSNIGRMDGWGIIVVVQPKGLGLEIAAQWKTGEPAANVSNWGGIPIHYNTGWDLVGMLNNAQIAAGYTITDLLKISLGFGLVPSSEGNPDTTAAALYPNATVRNIWARFELLAVQGLTAWFDIRYWGLENPTAQGSNINSIICVAYRAGDLFLVLGGQVGFGSISGTLSFKVAPLVEYKLGDIVLGLYGSLEGSTAAGAAMRICLQPYFSLPSLGGFMLSFQYVMWSDAAAGFNYWAVPIAFTFSFW